MVRGHSLTVTILVAAAIMFVGSRTSFAQDQTPSPQMLLNLDLFAPSNDRAANGSGAGDDSMLRQLRALRSMGYLNDAGPLPEVDYDPNPLSDAPAPTFPRAQGGQQ